MTIDTLQASFYENDPELAQAMAERDQLAASMGLSEVETYKMVVRNYGRKQVPAKEWWQLLKIRGTDTPWSTIGPRFDGVKVFRGDGSLWKAVPKVDPKTGTRTAWDVWGIDESGRRIRVLYDAPKYGFPTGLWVQADECELIT